MNFLMVVQPSPALWQLECKVTDWPQGNKERCWDGVCSKCPLAKRSLTRLGLMPTLSAAWNAKSRFLFCKNKRPKGLITSKHYSWTFPCICLPNKFKRARCIWKLNPWIPHLHADSFLSLTHSQVLCLWIAHLLLPEWHPLFLTNRSLWNWLQLGKNPTEVLSLVWVKGFCRGFN